MKNIYLDNASTTKMDKTVVKAMLPFFSQKYGNASSLYNLGQNAFSAMDQARSAVAGIFKADPREIIFTSGASESNNMAIKGIAEERRNHGKHLLISPIDHSSVVNAAQHLKNTGYDVEWLKVDKYGLIDKNFLEKSVRPDTILVSIGHSNNEIGTVQPIAQLVQIVKKKNHETVFHTDAVQSTQYCNLDVNELDVDLMSITGHKFYAPKGVGVLYVKKGISLAKLIDGGQQEFGKRAGTENVPYIVGLAKALEIVTSQRKVVVNKVTRLRDKLIKGITDQIDNIELTGHPDQRLPHIANFIFDKIEGESIILLMDKKRIAVSTGSACASHSLTPSHVLIGVGYPAERAHGSVRFSLGKDNTDEEINYVLSVLPPIIKKLRKISAVK